jgi:hypothetical protein
MNSTILTASCVWLQVYQQSAPLTWGRSSITEVITGKPPSFQRPRYYNLVISAILAVESEPENADHLRELARYVKGYAMHLACITSHTYPCNDCSLRGHRLYQVCYQAWAPPHHMPYVPWP